MGIFRNIFGKTVSEQQAGNLIVTSWQEGKPLYTPTDYQAQIDQNTKWVYRCVDIIANACASAPWNIYTIKTGKSTKLNFRHRSISKNETAWRESSSPAVRRLLRKSAAGAELVALDDHPFIDLMRRVAPGKTGLDLQLLKWKYKLLTGNAYLLKVRSKLNVPTQVWCLHSPKVRVIPSKNLSEDGFVSSYEYTVGNNKNIIDTKDIAHFFDSNPNSMYYGRSPMSAIVDDVTVQAYMDRFERDLFHNMAIPQTVLTTNIEKEIPQSAIDRIKAEFKKQFSFMTGKIGGKEPMILTHGITPSKLTMSPQDLNYAEGQQRVMKVIFGVFGVPFTKADPSQIMANNDAADRQFMKDTIQPLLIQDAEKMTDEFLAEYDERLIFGYENVVPDDKLFNQNQENLDIRNGVMTRNEIRALRGLEPLPPDIGDAVPSFPGQFPQFTLGQASFEAEAIARKMLSENHV